MRRGQKGFRGGYASSRHSLSVVPIAGKGADMQRDGWYSSMRNAADLASPEAVGRYAAERALSRLKSRKIATSKATRLTVGAVNAGTGAMRYFDSRSEVLAVEHIMASGVPCGAH